LFTLYIKMISCIWQNALIKFIQFSGGYVDDPTQWRYSSAINYESEEGLINVCIDW